VDDDVGCGQGVEYFVITDGESFADLKLAAVDIKPASRSDFVVVEGDGEGDGFDHRARFVGVLGKFGVEAFDIFLTDVCRVKASAAGQGKHLAGTALHDGGEDFMGTGLLSHLVENDFYAALEGEGDIEMQVVSVASLGLSARSVAEDDTGNIPFATHPSILA